jgi:hypothetical protein
VNAYADDADCGRCGKSVHLLHDAPCPHGYVACPECQHVSVCVYCREEAVADMFATGEYSAAADPLFNHLAPPPIDHAYVAGGYWWDGSWVTYPSKDKP